MKPKSGPKSFLAYKPGRTRSGKSSPRAPSLELFPVVGIGASAGGLEAFTQLLNHLPMDTGMSFVLIQHLDPDHASNLPQILARATTLPVHEITDGLRLQPNHVYVIPANRNLLVERGTLKLRPRSKARGAARGIDLFFESLAQDQKECAIGVILSGTASDGTLGLEAIKGEGGITFAQDVSAQYDSMPGNAIAAGCVDFVLAPEAIAQELARIAQHPSVVKVARSLVEKAVGKPDQDGLKMILPLLRREYGVDFSLYKPNTIERRIQRRMVLNRLGTREEYARFLQQTPAEREALYSDLLINVTSFFRNPAAFEALKRRVFPQFLKRSPEDPVRVWVLGCSTGQEAYSIAMAYLESAASVPGAPPMQVFATDLNEANLHQARAGFYPTSVIQDLAPGRLRRFFVAEPGGYRVNKQLRQMCVFARQNLASDPPFSRLDLISCRNVMIYLESELQRQVWPLFHYALKPNGFLFLGQSEAVGSLAHLFKPLDKKQKILSKAKVPTPPLRFPFGFTHPTAQESPVPHSDTAIRAAEPSLEREADRVLLNRWAPSGVIVNAQLEILQFRGDTGPYLQAPTGRARLNLLKMARAGLVQPLRDAINQTKVRGEAVRCNDVRVRQNGHVRTVHLVVIPLKNLKEPTCLVLFEEPPQTAASASGRFDKSAGSSPKRDQTRNDVSHRIADLERELAETRDQAQAYEEEQAAANEELQSTTEELQSGYEELQSINEELQTSKEELESNNEELTTLNEEIAQRNAESNQLYSDLTNLHASLNTAIILLGRDLSIRSFTPLAEKLFNLRSTDVNHSLSRIRHNLDCPNLEAAIAGVIDSLREHEQEVRDKAGRWYLARIRPYLTLDKRIDGAVLMLVDIDALKRSEQESARARDYAEAILQSTRYPLLVLTPELRILTANAAFYKMFKASAAETEGRLLGDWGQGQWNNPKLHALLEEVLPHNRFFDDFELGYEWPGNERRTLLLNARPLERKEGEKGKILLVIDDATDSKQMHAVRISEIRYRRLFEAAKDGVLLLDTTSRRITDANPLMSELMEFSHEELLGKQLFEVGLFADPAACEAAMLELHEKGVFREMSLTGRTKTGKNLELEMVSNRYTEEGRDVSQCNIRDITLRKTLERALFRTSQRLQALMDALPVGVSFSDDATCAHITGNPAFLAQFEASPDDNLSASSLDKQSVGRRVRFFMEGREITEAELPLQRAVAVNAQIPPVELEMRMPSGRMWLAAATAAPIRNDQGQVTGSVAVTVDVTERKELENRLRAALNDAESANRAKDDFLAALSHELRTPLNPILLLASEAANNTELPPGVRTEFESIRKNVELEARLIDDLLDLTRIKNGKLSLDLRVVDVEAILKDALANVEAEREHKSILIQLDFESGSHNVLGDAVRLQQVFWNVLRNAIKFTPEQGNIIVKTRAHAETQKMEVSITDTGIGMTPEEMARAFDAFSQGDHAGPGGPRCFGGVGLGLAISRMLVELHSGEIRVTSGGRNQGATFVIELPLGNSLERKEPVPPGRAEPSTQTTKPAVPAAKTKPRILLVEDHEPTRKALTQLLTRRQYAVKTAASLAEGRKVAAEESIDLLISDISLPDGTAYELMRDLRDAYGVIGIAMTGYGTATDVARSRAAGFQVHLTKPVRVESLEAALSAVAAAPERQASSYLVREQPRPLGR